MLISEDVANAPNLHQYQVTSHLSLIPPNCPLLYISPNSITQVSWIFVSSLAGYLFKTENPLQNQKRSLDHKLFGQQKVQITKSTKYDDYSIGGPVFSRIVSSSSGFLLGLDRKLQNSTTKLEKIQDLGQQKKSKAKTQLFLCTIII